MINNHINTNNIINTINNINTINDSIIIIIIIIGTSIPSVGPPRVGLRPATEKRVAQADFQTSRELTAAGRLLAEK